VLVEYFIFRRVFSLLRSFCLCPSYSFFFFIAVLHLEIDDEAACVYVFLFFSCVWETFFLLNWNCNTKCPLVSLSLAPCPCTPPSHSFSAVKKTFLWSSVLAWSVFKCVIWLIFICFALSATSCLFSYLNSFLH